MQDRLRNCLQVPSMDCLTEIKAKIESIFTGNIKPGSPAYRLPVHKLVQLINRYGERCPPKQINLEIIDVEPATAAAPPSVLPQPNYGRIEQAIEASLANVWTPVSDSLFIKIQKTESAVHKQSGIILFSILLNIALLLFIFSRIHNRFRDLKSSIGFNAEIPNRRSTPPELVSVAKEKKSTILEELSVPELRPAIIAILKDENVRQEFVSIFQEIEAETVPTEQPTYPELLTVHQKEISLPLPARNPNPEPEQTIIQSEPIGKLYAQPPVEGTQNFSSFTSKPSLKNIYCLEIMEGEIEAYFYPLREGSHLKKAVNNYDTMLTRACELENLPENNEQRIEIIEAGRASKQGDCWEINRLAKIKFIS